MHIGQEIHSIFLFVSLDLHILRDSSEISSDQNFQCFYAKISSFNMEKLHDDSLEEDEDVNEAGTKRAEVRKGYKNLMEANLWPQRQTGVVNLILVNITGIKMVNCESMLAMETVKRQRWQS